MDIKICLIIVNFMDWLVFYAGINRKSLLIDLIYRNYPNIAAALEGEFCLFKCKPNK
jgi:hypothetical protein